MLGHSHALSGLAAGAATLPWAPVHGVVGQVAWVAAAGGFAMLPDLDQASSTVSHMWGPLTDVPSDLVGKISGGHRWGTHDAVIGPVVFGLLAELASRAYWSSLLLMALAIGLALHACNFAIPGRVENTVIGNLLLSWGAAWLLLAHTTQPTWLPWAVAVGVLAHIAGDALTREGVPIPLVWIVHRCRVALTPMHTGAGFERVVFAPVFAALALVLLVVNTGAVQAFHPIVAEVEHTG